MMPEQRVKLRGILAQTASSAAIDGDGNLVVELYDFSAEAHRWLGNDVAFVLKIDAADKAEALRRLRTTAHFADASEGDGDTALLRLVAERFDDYYDVERWLNDQKIPFRKEFEPWA
ncbi:MAG: hypothetical protein M3N49_07285 [Candidatus Eremiobacteraeota bacterium]|nr:hypothetical protein [Candidatus Eremiobacteraeota bacterium]